MEFKRTAFAVLDGKVIPEDVPTDPDVPALLIHMADTGLYSEPEYGHGLWVCLVEWTRDGAAIGIRGVPRWEHGRVISESELRRLQGVDASVRTLGRTFAQGMHEPA